MKRKPLVTCSLSSVISTNIELTLGGGRALAASMNSAKSTPSEKGKRVGVFAEDQVGDGAVLVEGQVIRFADDENGGVVNIPPQLPGGAPVSGGGAAQELGHQQGAPGFKVGVEPVGQAPVPHHGFEVALEFIAAGVVAARIVLRVILHQVFFTGAPPAPRWAKYSGRPGR